MKSKKSLLNHTDDSKSLRESHRWFTLVTWITTMIQPRCVNRTHDSESSVESKVIRTRFWIKKDWFNSHFFIAINSNVKIGFLINFWFKTAIPVWPHFWGSKWGQNGVKMDPFWGQSEWVFGPKIDLRIAIFQSLRVFKTHFFDPSQFAASFWKIDSGAKFCQVGTGKIVSGESFFCKRRGKEAGTRFFRRRTPWKCPTRGKLAGFSIEKKFLRTFGAKKCNSIGFQLKSIESNANSIELKPIGMPIGLELV